jgi:hypothetical protein
VLSLLLCHQLRVCLQVRSQALLAQNLWGMGQHQREPRQHCQPRAPVNRRQPAKVVVAAAGPQVGGHQGCMRLH